MNQITCLLFAVFFVAGVLVGIGWAQRLLRDGKGIPWYWLARNQDYRVLKVISPSSLAAVRLGDGNREQVLVNSITFITMKNLDPDTVFQVRKKDGKLRLDVSGRYMSRPSTESLDIKVW